jgi:hypothetical protein
MFYSQSTGGFYDSEIHGDNMPEDVKKITQEDYSDLFVAQANGKIIMPDINGYPVATIPSLSLVDLKAAQITILTNAYNTAIQKPVSYMSTTFQADSDSQTKVIQVLAAMTPAGVTPAGFYWVDAANNHVAMTLAQVQGLSQAMMAQGWAAFQHLQTRKTSVNAATAIPDVLSVVW